MMRAKGYCEFEFFFARQRVNKIINLQRIVRARSRFRANSLVLNFERDRRAFSGWDYSPEIR